jgi:FkbM family methyltransferase
MTQHIARRSLYRERNLMAYPQADAADALRVEGISALLERLDAPLRLRLPQFDLVIELDHSVDANSAYLLAVDDYEMADLVLMHAHIKPQDKVLVVGGGIGVTAALAAKLTLPSPVVVVEANGGLHAIITRQIILNGSQAILVGKVLVGDKAAHPTGTIGFEISSSFWYSRVGETPDAVQVPVVDLAEVCAQYSPTVAMIDIEGAERDVFSRPIPACIKTIIVEIHTPDFGGAETARLVSALTDQGFRLVDQLALVWVFVRGV